MWTATRAFLKSVRWTELTPSAFRSLTQSDVQTTGRQVGRLITSFKWYFVSNMRVDAASVLKRNSYVNLRFDAMGDDTARVPGGIHQRAGGRRGHGRFLVEPSS